MKRAVYRDESSGDLSDSGGTPISVLTDAVDGGSASAPSVLIDFRRDTAANWTSSDPTLADGEPGYETDTGKVKIGDGTTAWNGLPYQGAAAGVNSLDGITGDVTLVAGSGITISDDDPSPGDITISADGSSGNVVVDYAQITSGTVSITATTEGTANSIVTGAGFTADGTSYYLVNFFSPQARPDTGAAGRRLTFVLLEGGTVIGQWGVLFDPAASNDSKPIFLSTRLQPSAGSRTYQCAAFVNAGTGAVVGGAGGTGTATPAYIMVTKLG